MQHEGRTTSPTDHSVDRYAPGSRRGSRTALPLIAATILAALVAALAPPAAVADEIHWLDEDRYLIRYKERRPEDVQGSVDRARSKAAALCLIASREVVQIDEPKFRVRLRAEQKDVSLDVRLLDELPADQPADWVAFPCAGNASQRDLETVRKALRKANIVPAGAR